MFENTKSKEKIDMASKQGLQKKMPKKFSCTDCGAYLCTKTGLKDHINAIHLKIKLFKCGHCEKLFTQKYKLVIHERKIHQELKHFQCDFCDASFDRKHCLKLHLGTVHLNIVVFLNRFNIKVKDFIQNTKNIQNN